MKHSQSHQTETGPDSILHLINLYFVEKLAGWMEQTPNNDVKLFTTLSETVISFFPFLFLIPFSAFVKQLLCHSITVIICCSVNAAFHCTMINSSKWVFLNFRSKMCPSLAQHGHPQQTAVCASSLRTSQETDLTK